MVAVGRRSSRNTPISMRCRSVISSVLAGGACEIWQQAGTEAATMDTPEFDISIPVQPLGTCELGIPQIGTAQREPERRAPIASTIVPRLMSLSRKPRCCVCELIAFRCQLSQKLRRSITVLCDVRHCST